MSEENVVSIDKKATETKDKYLEISSKYFDTRKELLEIMKKVNELQIEFSKQSNVVELQLKAQTLQKDIDGFLQELGEIELDAAGIEVSKPKVAKAPESSKKEKKDE